MPQTMNADINTKYTTVGRNIDILMNVNEEVDYWEDYTDLVAFPLLP